MKENGKTTMSHSRQRLIMLMQELNFGWIKGLQIRNGEPVFDPPPQVVRDIKFGGENGPRQEMLVEDFTLKSPVVELFELLDSMSDGEVLSLEVKHGLPFRMSVEEMVQI